MSKKNVNDSPEITSYEKAASESAVQKNAVPFEVVESYKNIRTNLIFMMSQSEKKSITISSSDQGVGNSTTAVNIAIAFAQLGDKVLLLDADMRIPTIHKKIKMQNTAGLSSILVGFNTFDDIVYHANSNLDVLSSGPLPPNPSELLSSTKMKNLICELESRYDYILIDTPPIGVVTDALVVAQSTAGMILVVRNNVSTYEQIEKCIAQTKLANIKLFGAILNGTNGDQKYGYRKKRSNYNYNYNSGYGPRGKK